MFHRILVPLDGSPFAERALPLAVRLATRDRAALILARIVPPIIPVAALGAAPPLDPELSEALQRESEAYLDEVALGIRQREQITATTVCRQGPVVQGLADIAADAGADLIIMTSHGRGGLSRVWLGSVADALLREVATPILLVRVNEAQPGLPATTCFDRILVPLDGSDFGDQALEPAFSLAERHGSRMSLLRVVLPERHLRGFPSEVWTPSATGRAQQATALDVLLRQAERLASRGITADAHVVAHEHPARAILDFAAEHQCDLIAMATHGEGGITRAVLGSVADCVVRGATRPVLLVRPPTFATTGASVRAAESSLALGTMPQLAT